VNWHIEITGFYPILCFIGMFVSLGICVQGIISGIGFVTDYLYIYLQFAGFFLAGTYFESKGLLKEVITKK
jgi:hypothetical protein